MLMSRKTLISAVTLSALVAGAAALSPAYAADAAMEKCTGINKAHANDCKGNGHSCAGQATKDRDPTEFVLVPAGTCSKIEGGMVAK